MIKIDERSSFEIHIESIVVTRNSKLRFIKRSAGRKFIVDTLVISFTFRLMRKRDQNNARQSIMFL